MQDLHLGSDIILRFRLHAVALITDIKKAFLMVSVAEDNQDVLRFLWLDNVNREIPQSVVLRFARVVWCYIKLVPAKCNIEISQRSI